MKILIASNNTHKIEEVKQILGAAKLNIEILTPKDLGIDINLDETGSTLELNAKLKAKAFYDIAQIPVVSDDTGLEVDALDGLPGVFSARYAGEACDSQANRDKLISELKKTGSKDWSAGFRTVICFYNGKENYFSGICKGKIIDEELGSGGFGYDSIFIPNGYDKTFAELSEDEKNSISHRGKALSYFAKYLKDNPPTMNIAFLASGGGSNMEAILKNIDNENLKANGVLLVTNNSKCGAVKIAQRYNMPYKHISSKHYENDEERDAAIADALLDAKAELVILAGYMKKVTQPLIDKFPNRILNIHPALLPKFGGHNYYGMKVHEAVIAAGENESGCTIHIVNSEYDSGRILSQTVVPVKEKDTPETLQKRVLKQEHILYSETIRKILENEIIL